jgi:hypothetical protein
MKSWLALLLMGCGLASCIPMEMCTRVGPLEAASAYAWLQSSKEYSEPLNTWVKNERLEKFLLKAYQQGGIEALETQFGFECKPRNVIPACNDCHTCRAIIVNKRVAPQEDAPNEYLCTKSGEMLLQVEAGPGPSTLNAMTYWRRSAIKSDVSNP